MIPIWTALALQQAIVSTNTKSVEILTDDIVQYFTTNAYLICIINHYKSVPAAVTARDDQTDKSFALCRHENMKMWRKFRGGGKPLSEEQIQDVRSFINRMDSRLLPFFNSLSPSKDETKQRILETETMKDGTVFIHGTIPATYNIQTPVKFTLSVNDGPKSSFSDNAQNH